AMKHAPQAKTPPKKVATQTPDKPFPPPSASHASPFHLVMCLEPLGPADVKSPPATMPPSNSQSARTGPSNPVTVGSQAVPLQMAIPGVEGSPALRKKPKTMSFSLKTLRPPMSKSNADPRFRQVPPSQAATLLL